MNRTKVIGRRRSRSLAGFASKDLCEKVPASDNPSERLMMLLNLSFQYALSVVRKEVMSEQDFDISEYREKGNECWEKVKSEVEKRNLEKLAVAENSISESFRCDNFEDFHEEMALFEEENVKWKEEVSSYRKDLEMSIDTPYVVDSSAWKDNEQHYNYSGVLKPVLSTHNKLARQVSSLSSTKKVFEACLEVDRKYCQALRSKSQNHFQQDTTYSPRPLARAFVNNHLLGRTSSARTYIKPYSLRK